MFGIAWELLLDGRTGEDVLAGVEVDITCITGGQVWSAPAYAVDEIAFNTECIQKTCQKLLSASSVIKYMLPFLLLVLKSWHAYRVSKLPAWYLESSHKVSFFVK